MRLVEKLILPFLMVGTSLIMGMLITGCVTLSSTIQKSIIDVPQSNDSAFYMLPFEPPQKQLVAKDRRVASGVPLGLLDILIIKSIKESNDVFNYTIDAQDLANLRQSNMQSVQASNAFEKVQVFTGAGDERPPKGLFLVIRLEEAGVVGNFNYAAVIKGLARIEDASEVVLGEAKLDANETGRITIRQSKNLAFKKVVDQVADLLKQVVEQRNAKS